MAICEKCGHDSARTVTMFYANGDEKVFCRVCKPKQHVDVARNPFDNFVCEHVKDEYGQKVKVNSLSELRAAEKRYNFALAVASDDDSMAAAPPQHDSWAGDLSHGYEKKWNKNDAAYSQSEIDKMKSAVGTVQDQSQTLADRPNSLNR